MVDFFFMIMRKLMTTMIMSHLALDVLFDGSCCIKRNVRHNFNFKFI